VEPPTSQDLDRRLGELALLAEPTRRSLYLYVTSQPHDVGRDEAAAAAGASRAQAAFHLDRMVEGGLLEASYRRLSGRKGPGAGRPDKLYRRSSRQHDVSLPPRDYELAADLLARAMEEPRGWGSRSSLGEVAGRFGQTIGADIRSRLGRRASRERALGAVAEALGRRGYQPYRRGAELRLRNCPFRALADAHRDLVCGMNLSLISGVVGGMEAADLEARREVVPGQCCVTIAPRQEGP
jgi:predicted ArsR family transcriptional regulator